MSSNCQVCRDFNQSEIYIDMPNSSEMDIVVFKVTGSFCSSPARERKSPDNGAFSTEIATSTPTTLVSDTVPGIQETAKDKRTAGRVWTRCMKMEQQSILLKTLKARKVGTADIENFNKKQIKSRKVKKNKVRDEDWIVKSMESKCEDAEDAAIELRRKKSKVRKALELKYGKNSSKLRNMVRNMKKQTTKMKEEVAAKNSQKVEHLTSKHKKESTEVPENLQKYRGAAVRNWNHMKKKSL